MADAKAAVDKVMGPKRWAEALEKVATALGVDAKALEEALLEHMGEFVKAPEGVGQFDAAAIAKKARRGGLGF